ncbi:MAG: hypothetical protein K1000chlam2_00873 [Chlamydiae bacterium]|nr:hypothetical protein [Chlamydiota bacterium]
MLALKMGQLHLFLGDRQVVFSLPSSPRERVQIGCKSIIFWEELVYTPKISLKKQDV